MSEQEYSDSDLATIPDGAMQIATTRAAQEVQAAMIVAKRFPRDEQAAFQRIIQACKRRALAEASQYAYPRGGQTVTGPSIRLAEVLAQAWGNVSCGTVELEQRDGESMMLAYAWDLESNTRCDKVFVVSHARDTRSGPKKLTDARDIYEMTANMGARRLRACILAVIPGDVVEAAIVECEKTMANSNSEPLADRIRKMVAAFAEMAVTIEMIEKRLGHKIDVCSETELIQLRKVYASIKDGMATREQMFELPKRGVKLSDLGGEATPEPAKSPERDIAAEYFRRMPQAMESQYIAWVAAAGQVIKSKSDTLLPETVFRLGVSLDEMEQS